MHRERKRLMFIRLGDVKQQGDTDDNVFILKTHSNEPLYISRSFAGHNIEKYTATERDRAIVYFNRQAAENALSTSFWYVDTSFIIERVPVNSEAKLAAKQADAIRKFEAKQKRAQRGLEHGTHKRNHK